MFFFSKSPFFYFYLYSLITALSMLAFLGVILKYFVTRFWICALRRGGTLPYRSRTCGLSFSRSVWIFRPFSAFIFPSIWAELENIFFRFKNSCKKYATQARRGAVSAPIILTPVSVRLDLFSLQPKRQKAPQLRKVTMKKASSPFFW